MVKIASGRIVNLVMFFKKAHLRMRPTKVSQSTFRIVCGLYAFLLAAMSSSAQISSSNSSPGPITGYFSVVHPLVSFSSAEPDYNFSDGYTVGFPIGVNYPKSEKLSFSMEFVPTIAATDSSSKMSSLLFHPGIIFRNIGGFSFPIRLAFETNGRYGFTAVVNKAIMVRDTHSYFLAMPFPVRFGNGEPASLTIGLQVGISF